VESSKKLGGPIPNMAKNQSKKTAKSCPKRSKICRKWPKNVEMAKNQLKKTAKSCQKMAKNCPRWPKNGQNGQKLSNMAKNCRNGQKMSKMVKIQPELS